MRSIIALEKTIGLNKHSRGIIKQAEPLRRLDCGEHHSTLNYRNIFFALKSLHNKLTIITTSLYETINVLDNTAEPL